MISGVAGFLFFALDLLLLMAIFRWLWQTEALLTRWKMLGLLIGVKLAILGGGVYLGLVFFADEVLSLVGGALVALLALTAGVIMMRRSV